MNRAESEVDKRKIKLSHIISHLCEDEIAVMDAVEYAVGTARYQALLDKVREFSRLHKLRKELRANKKADAKAASKKKRKDPLAGDKEDKAAAADDELSKAQAEIVAYVARVVADEGSADSLEWLCRTRAGQNRQLGSVQDEGGTESVGLAV